MWFERINRFYSTVDSKGNRLWEIKRVRVAVDGGFITTDEYEEITGE